ncbi:MULTISPECIES: hypothetical protein [unclassified Streptomyces]|uniref:hypothetical protein n=1 Tax=unclassified Streptomyces TaxID=2593676 RepID=UPI0037101D6E
MSVTHAFRAALVTVAIAGAATLGAQAAHAAGPAGLTAVAGASHAASAAGASTNTNPWD